MKIFNIWGAESFAHLAFKVIRCFQWKWNVIARHSARVALRFFSNDRSVSYQDDDIIGDTLKACNHKLNLDAVTVTDIHGIEDADMEFKVNMEDLGNLFLEVTVRCPFLDNSCEVFNISAAASFADLGVMVRGCFSWIWDTITEHTATRAPYGDYFLMGTILVDDNYDLKVDAVMVIEMPPLEVPNLDFNISMFNNFV
ncbi:hypothetical protein TSUD_42790 [Trifolium subterraneum]|uniref:Uncharacterized protein n=1 Tax=Trifolium subterraneum TaxID=3900 RepID=A0A2Z6LL22_TRISU|nr:hypothetical protein TSUD_42790 [Trifolium subterraneum]